MFEEENGKMMRIDDMSRGFYSELRQDFQFCGFKGKHWTVFLCAIFFIMRRMGRCVMEHV